MAIRATVIDPTGNGAELVGPAAHAGIGTRVAGAILETIAAIPTSAEPASQTPSSRAAVLTKKAAQRAAGISGGAALVPGPLGMLSLLPDIIGVWKVQAQMVADIAAAYGKTATLTNEQMLYCLFKHMSSHWLRDVVVRMGERFLVRRASLQCWRRPKTEPLMRLVPSQN